MTKLTKEYIREGLEKSDSWLLRGLMVIYSFQTEAEKAMGVTQEDNGMGFNGVDAEFMTSLAEQYQARGFLTRNQIAHCRRKMLKYSGQLLKVAKGEVELPQ